MEVKVKSKVTEIDINSNVLVLKGLTRMNTHTISVERTFDRFGTHSQVVDLFVYDEDLGEVVVKVRSEGIIQNQNLNKLIDAIASLKNSD